MVPLKGCAFLQSWLSETIDCNEIRCHFVCIIESRSNRSLIRLLQIQSEPVVRTIWEELGPYDKCEFSIDATISQIQGTEMKNINADAVQQQL